MLNFNLSLNYLKGYSGFSMEFSGKEIVLISDQKAKPRNHGTITYANTGRTSNLDPENLVAVFNYYSAQMQKFGGCCFCVKRSKDAFGVLAFRHG